MDLAGALVELGRGRFERLLAGISIGSLKRFQVFDNFKIRAGVSKLNREKLRKAGPGFWSRIEAGESELAKEIAQAVLVSHLDFVAGALDFLEIPHDGNGFFDKDDATREKLGEGWQKRVFDRFKDEFPEELVLLYINHLDWELNKPDTVFTAA